MTKRWVISGVAVVVTLLGATAGIAYAAGSGSGPSNETPVVGQMVAACDAMHDTPAMQAMHDHMPAALQVRCDALHEQMDQMMGSGMMGGSEMMGGSGMTGTSGGSMADHHPSTEG
jgi:hypothetical protein